MMKKENVVIKKGCHPRGMLSGISRIRLRKQTVSAYLHTTKQKGDSQQKPLGMTPYFTTAHGFTLIELLVVVLIIGILAAVAVPQYRKAVLKTRYAELQSLVKSLYQAQQIYYLANNTYTTQFSDLDIELSNISSGGGKVQYFRENNFCALGESYLSCKNVDINMAYRMDYTGERACVAYNADDMAAHQICKAETSRNEPSEGYSSTYFYP